MPSSNYHTQNEEKIVYYYTQKDGDSWVTRMDSKRSGITRVETRFLLGDSVKDITLLRRMCLDMPHPLEFASILNLPDRPFPSYFVPLFQNEAWCKTIHMKMVVGRSSFLMKDLKTRFDTETKASRKSPIENNFRKA